MRLAVAHLLAAKLAHTMTASTASRHKLDTHHLLALLRVPLRLRSQVVLACPKGQVDITLVMLLLHRRTRSLHQAIMEDMHLLPARLLQVVVMRGDTHLHLDLLHQVVILVVHLQAVTLVALHLEVILSKVVILRAVILRQAITFRQAAVTTNMVEAEAVGESIPEKCLLIGLSFLLFHQSCCIDAQRARGKRMYVQ